LLLVGCDLVWQLERNVPPTCGPFGAPSLVPFHPELIEPRDFSVDNSGVRGLIYAQYPRASRPTGVHAIKLENDLWRADPMRDTGVLSSLDGGHIAENDFAVGWLFEEGGDRPEIREYQFFPAGWSPGGSGLLDPLQASRTRCGSSSCSRTRPSGS
jgi:hypothetical protein